jgi:signal transduction histidine kinase
MNASLKRSENQTNWAGKFLLCLGIFGALGGLLSGFATARRLDRKETRLSVRVQAVQAHLDQEVGTVTLEAPSSTRDLDEQLDRVIDKVKKVCEKLQEQERDLLRADQLAAVGHLAAGVAHEIRNPLTGIKFLIEAALSPHKSTPLSTEDLRLVQQEIIRMERTIQELLDFARKPQLDRRSHDLKSLLMEATAITRGRAAVKPVSIRVDAPSSPIAAEIDHDQILSLLTNLLLNSIDATPPGGEVLLGIDSAPNGFFKIEVVDNGPGIDPAIANRLFTPFATTKSTGTGLGLTIAHRIAHDHGGTLAASNRPQGGACFTLTLPITENANGEAPRRR